MWSRLLSVHTAKMVRVDIIFNLLKDSISNAIFAKEHMFEDIGVLER
jgi:hypothetical protein